MISCAEFIPAYSEGFGFLEEKGGRAKVDEFWAYLSDVYLSGSLKALIEKKGLYGCYIYWEKALKEEAADFKMSYDEKKEEFKIDILQCPSKGMLLKMKHMEPYEAYCEHCPALYSRVLKAMGYEYSMDMSRVDRAQCSLEIKKMREED